MDEELKHDGMTKKEYGEWLLGIHTPVMAEYCAPEELIFSYFLNCENMEEDLALCEVPSRNSATGNPVSFDLPVAWFF